MALIQGIRFLGKLGGKTYLMENKDITEATDAKPINGYNDPEVEQELWTLPGHFPVDGSTLSAPPVIESVAPVIGHASNNPESPPPFIEPGTYLFELASPVIR